MTTTLTATTLTRREAALLGFLLRQVREAAGDALTGHNLLDLLRVGSIALRDGDEQIAILIRKLLRVVRALPLEQREALVRERCRLRQLENDLLALEPPDGETE